MSTLKDKATLGQQLSCPSGEAAKEVGDMMFSSNQTMIYNTIDQLDVNKGQNILEVGFANGRHIPYLFEKETDISYTGIEISDAMIAASKENNIQLSDEKKIELLKTENNGILDFDKEAFDICYSVNTIYFWKNPLRHLIEIYRILKPKGTFALTFIDRDFGKTLEFTKQGFELPGIEEIKALLRIVDFKNIQLKEHREAAISKDGSNVIRPYYIVTSTK
nr:class I SAM-dependent methyltransferase [uncultured Flavobacterium sp.]